MQFRKIDYALTRVIRDPFNTCLRARKRGKFDTSISNLKFLFNFSTSISELLALKIVSFNENESLERGKKVVPSHLLKKLQAIFS